MNKNSYTLNQGQKDAAEAFFSFLFDPDHKEFILSGPAGTGKTYWMGYIIDEIMPRYHETCKLVGIDPVYEGVQMTATTNKSADVLGQATGRPTQTIHSFLNLRVFEDYSSGSMKLEKNPRTWTVHEKLILFIDECSMIDSRLYKLLHEGTHNCKIVYVGDHSQLAPVTEVLSPIYRQNSPFFVLTQPMRTEVPELLNLNQQLRDTVETGLFQPIREVPGVIDYLDNADMQRMLDTVFAEQTKESRILAYTNRRVIEFNDYIRQMRNLPKTFQQGEILVNNAAIRLRNRKSLSVEQEIEITNNKRIAKVEIDPGVMLEVNYLDFQDNFYNSHFDVPVPTDREHFDALVKYYRRQKNWERYFHLKQGYPDLRPRDAATVHKAQGSTYDSVFVDLGNISSCHQADQAARMLYVAFSRARTRVFVYGDLAPKYGGFIRV